MKKGLLRTLSIALCAAILISCAGGAIYTLAAGNGNNESAQKTDAAKPADPSERETEPSKEETVYVLAGADGSVKKLIVSDWIKNALGSAKLNDVSELTDIENVKGDETYTLGGGNSRVWDAEGNDIYYQGNIEKELPVSMAVSYKLNGKPITPDELAGKSGKVTIRFDYENKQY
ncbi:MAG: hypothetical protein IJ072_06975, partial [Oscillospiraceae bacterium]|nr:hypothetical protein [Oscillospiraceae bacterium]